MKKIAAIQLLLLAIAIASYALQAHKYNQGFEIKAGGCMGCTSLYNGCTGNNPLCNGSPGSIAANDLKDGVVKTSTDSTSSECNEMSGYLDCGYRQTCKTNDATTCGGPKS